MVNTPALKLAACPWKLMVGRWSFPFGGEAYVFGGELLVLGRVGKYTMGNLAGFYPRHVLKSAGFPRDWATLLDAWMLPCKVDRIFAQRQVPSKRPKEKGLCRARVMTLQASCFLILPENKTLNLKKAAPLGKHTKETSTRLPKAPVLKSFHPPFLGAYIFPTHWLPVTRWSFSIWSSQIGWTVPLAQRAIRVGLVWTFAEKRCVCLSIFHQRLRRLNKWHTCWHIYI